MLIFLQQMVLFHSSSRGVSHTTASRNTSIYTALTVCVCVRSQISDQCFIVQSMKAFSVGLITQTDRVGLLYYYYYGNIEQLFSSKNHLMVKLTLRHVTV